MIFKRKALESAIAAAQQAFHDADEAGETDIEELWRAAVKAALWEYERGIAAAPNSRSD